MCFIYFNPLNADNTLHAHWQMSLKLDAHPFNYGRNTTFNFSHFNVYTPYRRHAAPNVPTVLTLFKEQISLFLFNFKHKIRGSYSYPNSVTILNFETYHQPCVSARKVKISSKNYWETLYYIVLKGRNVCNGQYFLNAVFTWVWWNFLFLYVQYFC